MSALHFTPDHPRNTARISALSLHNPLARKPRSSALTKPVYAPNSVAHKPAAPAITPPDNVTNHTDSFGVPTGCDVSHVNRSHPTQHSPRVASSTLARPPHRAAPAAPLAHAQKRDTLPPVTSAQPDAACLAASRSGTTAQALAQMVALRRAGRSLRQIGREMGRCMEGVRQALMRYEAACAPAPEATATADDWAEPLRDAEPLPPGHPIAQRGLWHGLDYWRTLACSPTATGLNTQAAAARTGTVGGQPTRHTPAQPLPPIQQPASRHPHADTAAHPATAQGEHA